MSVFKTLMSRAKELGARKLWFDVDLTADPTAEAWIAQTNSPGCFMCRGRSGEEALRNLVDVLERERA